MDRYICSALKKLSTSSEVLGATLSWLLMNARPSVPDTNMPRSRCTSHTAGWTVVLSGLIIHRTPMAMHRICFRLYRAEYLKICAGNPVHILRPCRQQEMPSAD